MRKFIAAVMTIAILFVCLFPSTEVRAASQINLSVVPEQDPVNKGDILVLNVVADSWPDIMNFSNVLLNYDEVSLSYESSAVSTELPESFAVSIELLEDGLLSIEGSDETLQDSVDATLIGEESDDTDTEIVPFYSDSPVVLCTLYFRVKASAFDFLSFSFVETEDEKAEFVNTSYEVIPGVATQDFSVAATSDVSTDSRIVALKVNGNAVVDFKPDTYEYMMNVANEVNELEIDAEPGNSAATINYSDLNLAFGENIITIEVVAQDGVTVSTYKLKVNRQSSYLQEGANFIDKRGRVFSFVSAPADVVIPEKFVETTAIVNNFEVSCYRCDGVRQLLIYAFDGEGNTGLYFYDPLENNVIPYDASTTIIRQSLVLNVTEVPENEIIPDDYIPAKFIYAGSEYDGYINPSGEVICYLSNEHGKGMFYSYDYGTQTFIKYKPVDKSTETLYKLLFNVCLGIAIIESMAIIFIVYIVRRYRKERTNPRPRRV